MVNSFFKNIAIPTEVYEKILKFKLRNGVTIRFIVAEAVDLFLEREKKRGSK